MGAALKRQKEKEKKENSWVQAWGGNKWSLRVSVVWETICGPGAGGLNGRYLYISCRYVRCIFHTNPSRAVMYDIYFTQIHLVPLCTMHISHKSISCRYVWYIFHTNTSRAVMYDAYFTQIHLVLLCTIIYILYKYISCRYVRYIFHTNLSRAIIYGIYFIRIYLVPLFMIYILYKYISCHYLYFYGSFSKKLNIELCI